MTKKRGTNDTCPQHWQGKPCMLTYGMPEHELTQLFRPGQLGLPVLVHKAADGTRWTEQEGLLR